VTIEQTGSQIVIAATFFLIPTLGEMVTERSGILNLGIEGMVISGAAGSFAAAHITGNLWIGAFVGALIGGLLALTHAIVTITFNRNQVVSGISLTILGTGLSSILGLGLIGVPIVPFGAIAIPGLSAIPIIGPIFFDKNVLVYFSYVMVPVLWFILFKTRYGIMIRSVGENPMAAYTQGVDVVRIRYLSVIFGGMMCGLGGAYLTLAWIPMWVEGITTARGWIVIALVVVYLTLAWIPMWVEGITTARGWIVIALVVVGLWHPVGAFVGSYIFGAFDVLRYAFQPLGIPTAFLNMLPSLSTILFLVIWGVLLNMQKVKSIVGAPSSLCVPFETE
jgi:simple sugar transport system permease protein